MPSTLLIRRVVLCGAAAESADAGGPDLAPVNITAPVVSGTARVGETLHATNGTWQYNPGSFLYVWRQDGGTNCTGTGWASADYEPNDADIGFELYCSIVAQNSAGDSLEVDSNNSAEVVASNNTNLSTFTVDGSNVTDGQTVNLANGTTSVTVVATPQDPSATVGAISGDTSLITGDNPLSFTVTAADGVTTRNYGLTLHVLNTGLPEVTQITFADSGVGGSIVFSATSPHRYGLWLNVDSGGSQPDLSAQGVTDYVECFYNSAWDGAAGVAGVIIALLTLAIDTSASSGATLVLTAVEVGPKTDAVLANSPSGLTLSVTQQGANPS